VTDPGTGIAAWLEESVGHYPSSSSTPLAPPRDQGELDTCVEDHCAALEAQMARMQQSRLERNRLCGQPATDTANFSVHAAGLRSHDLTSSSSQPSAMLLTPQSSYLVGRRLDGKHGGFGAEMLAQSYGSYS